MAALLQLPVGSAPADEHADWLEQSALAAADRTSSLQDLVQALRRSGSLDAEPGAATAEGEDDPRAEVSEIKAQDAFAELDDRARSCGHGGYPFTVAAQYLQAWNKPERSVYTFLLLLSHFGLSGGPDGIDAASLFEAVSASAATAYLGGRGKSGSHVLFGSPRRGRNAGFRAAVNDLCRQLGEGGGCRARHRLQHQQDAKLDLVVWQPFRDGRACKVIAFGQCATGRGWRAKLSELQPKAFCGLWLRDPLPVDPLRMFFVPFRIDRAMWEESSFYGGLLFDRCRISAHAMSLTSELREQCLRWSRHVIRESLR